MEEDQKRSDDKKKSIDLWTFIGTLYKRRKLLLVNFLILCVVTVAVSLILPLTYSSTAVIMPPGGSSSLLSSFLPSNMTTGLGSAIGGILGNASDEANKAMAILGSRTLAVKTIDKFHLVKRFDSPTIEDAIKTYHQKVEVTLNDDGTISVTTSIDTRFFHPQKQIDEARHLSADITNYVVEQLNKIYTKLNTSSAKLRRQLIEKRYQKNIADIQQVAEQLKEFEQKYGIVSLPDQIEATVNVAAQLETEVIKSQIELQTLKQTLSPHQSQIKQKEIQINQLQNKLSTILNGKLSEDSLKIIPSFSEIPTLAVKYATLKREADVQEAIYQYLTQIYEQAKLAESQKSADIQIIDHGAVPTKKSKPKRSIVVLLSVFAGMLFTCVYIFMKERMYKEGLSWEQIKIRVSESSE